MSKNQKTKHREKSNHKKLDERKKWMEHMTAILSRFGKYSKPFSIAIVPEKLRKCNRNAYMPKVICIGPRYRGTRKDLLQMEKTKWHCMLSLLHRSEDLEAPTNLDKCWELFSTLNDDVRTSYVGDLNQKECDLAKFMLCDACFLLELLICKSKELDDKFKSRHTDHPARQVLENEHVLTDLLVLENQIPLDILHKLSEILFDKGAVPVETLEITALNLFGYSPDWRFHSAYPAPNFLELVHSYISWKSERNQIQGTHHDSSVIVINVVSPEPERHRCARLLEAAGVKIKPRGEGIPSGFDFDIVFSKSSGELKIPPLHITKETEVRWRNLIAWEQSHIGFQTKHTCTGAALLFNGLICCEKDVQILKGKGVIIVDYGLKRSNKQLLEFFRSMVKGVDLDKITDSSYWAMVYDLNHYSARNLARQIPTIMWHSWLPKFIRKVLNVLLRGYTLMLATISVFTILQACFTIAKYYNPKN